MKYLKQKCRTSNTMYKCIQCTNFGLVLMLKTKYIYNILYI